MGETLPLNTRRAVSPYREMGAYEALWDRPKASFKRIADTFRECPGCVPSDLVDADEADRYAALVMEAVQRAKLEHFGVRLHRTGEYPEKLRDALNPVELLYYSGWWDLAFAPAVAVVGTRNPSSEGRARARKLVRHLVEDNFTVVSGLAAGIDTEAHRTALEAGGQTVAVIGTPLSETYPKENADLQKEIAAGFLVISQVPVCAYSRSGPQRNRFFFPERNVTMSALSLATVIVEAGETSGTLIQARAALHQGRQLFILDSCFKRSLKWPERFEAKGAIRVRDYEEIREHLASATAPDHRPADS